MWSLGTINKHYSILCVHRFSVYTLLLKIILGGTIRGKKKRKKKKDGINTMDKGEDEWHRCGGAIHILIAYIRTNWDSAVRVDR